MEDAQVLAMKLQRRTRTASRSKLSACMTPRLREGAQQVQLTGKLVCIAAREASLASAARLLVEEHLLVEEVAQLIADEWLRDRGLEWRLAL